jgi:hypothetical protein
MWFAWRALRAHGFGPFSQAGPVTVFARGGSARVAEPPEPEHGAVRCDGWRDGTLVRTPGELWIFGTRATVALELRGVTERADVSVDGRPVARLHGSRTLRLALGDRGWHLVRVDRHGHGTLRLGSVNAT